jgi:hypothetical protein
LRLAIDSPPKAASKLWRVEKLDKSIIFGCLRRDIL